MAAEAGTGQPYAYATQVGRLWSGVTGTLTRLEAIAGDPARLEDDDAAATLRGLQYRLHLACERAYGLAPPAGTAVFHEELAGAIEAARDVTGEVVETLEVEGAGAVDLLVHEWRGALFRVRLARLRLAGPRPRAVPEPSRPGGAPRAAALLALVLAVAGTVTFTLGANAGEWPIWTVGIAALCAGFIVYKP